MKIIVGLGNPGVKYAFTRHNLGFMLIDVLAEGRAFQNKQQSLIQKTEIEKEPVLLVKPQTFMNLSGQAVREILSFYKTPIENLLVLHDDKDLPFGAMRVQKSRGPGGHNGVANIHQALGSPDYCRLKMGVAPAMPAKKEETNSSKETSSSLRSRFSERYLTKNESERITDTSRFVLSSFKKEEQKQLDGFLERGVRAVGSFVEQGYEKTANLFNHRKS